jgi:hypothetical protein
LSSPALETFALLSLSLRIAFTARPASFLRTFFWMRVTSRFRPAALASIKRATRAFASTTRMRVWMTTALRWRRRRRATHLRARKMRMRFWIFTADLFSRRNALIFLRAMRTRQMLVILTAQWIAWRWFFSRSFFNSFSRRAAATRRVLRETSSSGLGLGQGEG